MLRLDAHSVVAEDKPPLAALVVGAQLDGGALAGIGYGVVGEVAEDAVEQTLVAVDDEPFGQVYDCLHALLLQLQGGGLGDARHELRHVDIGKVHHLDAVVHLVERRYVLQQ